MKSAYLSDVPSVDDDGLGFDVFKEHLLTLILQSETPLTIGILGTWGTGKTTLLKKLKKSIDEKKLRFYRTVWFTAWKYERQDALWRAFILRVIGALWPKKDDGDPYKADELSNGQKELVEELARLEESVYESVFWEAERQWALNTEAIVKGGIRLPLWLASRLFSIPDLSGIFGHEGSFDILRKEIRRQHILQLEHMEQFAERFQNVVNLSLRDTGRLVVFVDDLDRCLPEKAVEILEAIKLFLNVPGTVFVLGLDREVIRKGIEIRYNRTSGRKTGQMVSIIDGDMYLQKIIQVPFALPVLDLNSRHKFIKFLEDKLPEDFRLPSDDVTREIIARGSFPYPRQIKRIINGFNLLRQIAGNYEDVHEKSDYEGIFSPLLAKSVIIQMQWPEIYSLWKQYPTLVQTLEKIADKFTFLHEGEASLQAESDEDVLSTMEKLSSLGARELEVQLRQNHVRYAQLIDMMRYPPLEDERSGKARFKGLDRSQLIKYLSLVSQLESPGEGHAEIRSYREVYSGLSSGERVKIYEALAILDEIEQDPNGPLHQDAKEMLYRQMRDASRPVFERVASGEALSDRLGDPRFKEDIWYLSDEPLMGFVPVPAGDFKMGQGEEEHVSPVPYLYYIARFPVTVAQFRAFVKDGYEASIDADTLNRILRSYPTHPVTWVSWENALDYAHWLNDKLRGISKQKLLEAESSTEQDFWQGLNTGSLQVILPSEAEWEKAARGGLEIPRIPFDPQQISTWKPEDKVENPRPERLYPWGSSEFEDIADPDKANYAETQIGTTSPVGCFPTGASPYGVEELAGNVREWTRSLDGEYPYPTKPEERKRREALDVSGTRVLRGGAFVHGPELIQCTSRRRYDQHQSYRLIGFRVAIVPKDVL